MQKNRTFKLNDGLRIILLKGVLFREKLYLNCHLPLFQYLHFILFILRTNANLNGGILELYKRRLN